MAWKAVPVLCLFARAAAYPDRLLSSQCRPWAPGMSGHMNTGPLADGAALNSGNPNCEVSVTGELVASQEYTVTVTAAVSSLMKLYASDEQCLNPNEAHTMDAHVAMSLTFTWMAPASIDPAGITFYALCGANFSLPLYAAAPVQLCPAGGCVEETTSSTGEMTSSTPSQIATVNDVQLAEGMFLSFKPATTAEMEEGIEITVTLNQAVWIGIGFSTGDEVSMNGGGAGAEIYVCSDAAVRRYWLAGPAKTLNVANEAVDDSSCSQTNGAATMTFKRSLAANGNGDGHAVTPGSFQQVIWAHSDAGSPIAAYHQTDRGGVFIDFATGDSPTEPPSTTAASSGESSVATIVDLELTSGMLLSFNPATTAENEEGIFISVTFNDDVWIGMGFSGGSGVSMIANGNGADIYICTGGDVRRHPSVKVKGISGSGEAVPDSSCVQANGGTTMTFTRSLAGGRRLDGRAVRPGSSQQVIWAHGSGSATTVANHGTSNRGGLFIDFATGETGEAFLEGQAPLYIHIVLMILAWGFFLPAGVALAKCLRRAPNGTAGGVWFGFHWKFQALGFVLTMLGLGAAIWYAEEYSLHFDQGHSIIGIIVCALAGLQVLGGALRPHKDDPPSTLRVAFEYGHKGLGYIAILLGALNIILGIVLVYDLEFESAVKSLAVALAVIFMLPVVIYVAISAVMPDNPLAQTLLGKQNVAIDGEAATTIGNSAK